MPVREATIRDSLAANLSLLEEGLTLVRTEAPLASAVGADGRVDILARDEFDNFVVIEIKRSDQSAREALHEIFKYASILTHELGIKSSRLRVIVASTDWHELRLPFSSYVRRSICDTTGYKLDVDGLGIVRSATKIEPEKLRDPLQFSKYQSIYLYQAPEARDANLDRMSRALASAGVPDHVLVACDYRGDNPEIIFPFGICTLLSLPDPADEEHGADVLNKLRVPVQTVDAGGPDVLATMIQKGWALRIARRSGRLEKSARTVSDADLLDIAVTFDRASQHWLAARVTPRLGDQWEEFRGNILPILAGNSEWYAIAPLLLDEIAARDRRAKISFVAYNLADTAMMLKGLANDSTEYCPTLEITSVEAEGTRTVMSRPVWTGRPLWSDAGSFFDRAYGSFTRYNVLRYAGDLFTFDDLARSVAEIETPIFERWAPSDGSPTNSVLYEGSQGLARRPITSADLGRGLAECVARNSHFFRTWSMHF